MTLQVLMQHASHPRVRAVKERDGNPSLEGNFDTCVPGDCRGIIPPIEAISQASLGLKWVDQTRAVLCEVRVSKHVQEVGVDEPGEKDHLGLEERGIGVSESNQPLDGHARPGKPRLEDLATKTLSNLEIETEIVGCLCQVSTGINQAGI